MTSLPLNLDGDRRDRLIFGQPLDWQTQTAQQRRVSFDQLPLSVLEQLIQEGFVQNLEQPRSDPTAPELVEIAYRLIKPRIACWFEVAVSPPLWQETVLITAVRFEGVILALADRAFFWQAFHNVRTVEMAPWLLRATFGTAAHHLITHPLMPYQDVVPWDLPEPEDGYDSIFA